MVAVPVDFGGCAVGPPLAGVVGVTLFEGCGVVDVVVRTGVDGLLADALTLDGGQSVADGVALAVVEEGAAAEVVALALAPAEPPEPEGSAELAVAVAVTVALSATLDVGSVLPAREAETEEGTDSTQGPVMAVPAAAEAGSDRTVPYTSEPSPSEKATTAAARRLRRKTDTPAEGVSVEASPIEVF